MTTPNPEHVTFQTVKAQIEDAARSAANNLDANFEVLADENTNWVAGFTVDGVPFSLTLNVTP